VTVSFGIQGSGQQVDRAVPDAGRLRAIAQAAEELGYDSIWAGDHISFRNPIVDIVVALTTFAAATERIAIGAGVVLLPLRHPSVVAKEFASLDHVSGGRVILGVGVGGEGGKDFTAVGVDPRERGARTDEAMRALRELFRGRATFSGRFFSFTDVEIAPGPAQPGGPRLWVGGRSPAAVRRAATLGDGWIPIFVSPARFADGRRELPPHVTPAVTLPAHVGPKRELYEHLRQRYGGDFTEYVVDRYCVAGSPDECAARIGAYVDAGARHIVFNVAEPEDAERLAEVALAAAR
jgi:probable F420-dependent oxidoreductase